MQIWSDRGQLDTLDEAIQSLRSAVDHLNRGVDEAAEAVCCFHQFIYSEQQAAISRAITKSIAGSRREVEHLTQYLELLESEREMMQAYAAIVPPPPEELMI